MLCPYCKADETKVVDSRLVKDRNSIRRRRECEACKRRFTTYERVDEPLPVVVKRDAAREPFDRHKVIAGLKRACQKRPIGIDALEEVVDGIERALLDRGEREVPSVHIGELALEALRELDEVAYVRFASVYRDFGDVEEFMAELQKLIARRAR